LLKLQRNRVSLPLEAMSELSDWEERSIFACLWLLVITIAFVFQTLQINKLARRIQQLELLVVGNHLPEEVLLIRGAVIGRLVSPDPMDWMEVWLID
jgi:hypothetical protein